MENVFHKGILILSSRKKQLQSQSYPFVPAVFQLSSV